VQIDVPVLEIGGTHVLGAVVTADTWTVRQSRRQQLDSNGTASEILDAFVAAGSDLLAPSGANWGIAMPDPFDYARGIATFRNVGKFDAIYGVDIGAVLRERLPGHAARISFVNDADAFILGEWTHGSAAGHGRCVGITLGTGLGSGWLIDGHITDSAAGVPLLGRARTLIVNGAGLEETMSRRALRQAYGAASGDHEADVIDISERARGGEQAAVEVLRHGFRGLGRAMGPAMREFGADVVVIGGSMAASWDLFEPWFLEGMDWPKAPPIRLAANPDHAAVLGAARFALDAAQDAAS
jgi:glucokinase